MAHKPTELRPIMTRIPEGLRGKLERSAKKNERSMNAEINYRLENSFTEESAFGGREMKAVALNMFVAFTAAGAGAAYGKGLKGDWIDDPDCYRSALFGVIEALMLRNSEATSDLDLMMREVERLKGGVASRIVNSGARK